MIMGTMGMPNRTLILTIDNRILVYLLSIVSAINRVRLNNIDSTTLSIIQGANKINLNTIPLPDRLHRVI